MYVCILICGPWASTGKTLAPMMISRTTISIVVRNRDEEGYGVNHKVNLIPKISHNFLHDDGALLVRSKRNLNAFKKVITD